MKLHTSTIDTAVIYYRLIALWVFGEAMLGGIIHGFGIPVSGLVVGSYAVVCISLMAWYVPAKGAILKATIIVAIFKMMLSPQAPPPAYLAVFFQGLTGEALFWNRKFYRTACMALAVLALLESGLQRILVLTVVYGNDLWKAINAVFNNLISRKETINYSLFIISGYVLLHLFAGILMGLWAGLLPQKITSLHTTYKQYITKTDPENLRFSQKKRKNKIIIFIVWGLLIALYIQSYYNIGKPLLSSHISLRIFLRSVIIVLSWYFILRLFLRKMLNKWLQKKETKFRYDVKQVLELLPAMQQLVSQSWKMANEKKGWKRVSRCWKIILANTFYADDV